MNLLVFFNHPFFTVVGALSTIVLILGVLFKSICWFFKVTPIVFKFGISLLDRKIAVFTSQEGYNQLKNCLIDSKIFKEKNIIHIAINNIDKSKNYTVFLVEWESFKDKINDVFLARKNDQVPVVIYANPGSIPNEIMSDIANRPNTVVVNFKGRLLNDILTSLVTTTYESN